jgi:hypothetical protein
MFKQTRVVFLAALTAASLAACTSVEDKHESTHLAAHAAATTYPSDLEAKQSDHVGAIIDTGGQALQIVNFGNFTINNADVWVNDSYNYHIDTLPPNGYLKIDMGQFYDKDGNTLTQHDVRINLVQISANGKLWTLLGPINH